MLRQLLAIGALAIGGATYLQAAPVYDSDKHDHHQSDNGSDRHDDKHGDKSNKHDDGDDHGKHDLSNDSKWNSNDFKNDCHGGSGGIETSVVSVPLPDAALQGLIGFGGLGVFFAVGAIRRRIAASTN